MVDTSELYVNCFQDRDSRNNNFDIPDVCYGPHTLDECLRITRCLMKTGVVGAILLSMDHSIFAANTPTPAAYLEDLN